MTLHPRGVRMPSHPLSACKRVQMGWSGAKGLAMKCQRCPKTATLHITEVLGEDRYEEVHLCEDCAKKYLVEPPKIGGPSKAGAPEEANEEAEQPPVGPTCDACGI